MPSNKTNQINNLRKELMDTYNNDRVISGNEKMVYLSQKLDELIVKKMSQNEISE